MADLDDGRRAFEISTQSKRCSHDQVQHHQIRRYRPRSRDRGRRPGVGRKRPEHAGEDGLPRRCRIVLLAIHRQTLADAGLPRAEQGQDLHALPPGRASAWRLIRTPTPAPSTKRPPLAEGRPFRFEAATLTVPN